MVNRSRTKSSQRWLERQHSDPYVQKARQTGFRSRAAYKLLEIQERDKLIQPSMTVVDLGAAPGGWSQVAVEKAGPKGKVLALDILPMDPIKGVDIVVGDFKEEQVMEQLVTTLGERKVDVVISDMAPNLSGISAVDQARAAQLADMAIELVEKVLVQNGSFLIKVFQGQESVALTSKLKQRFKQVMVRKPKASRAESRELYLLAKGYCFLEKTKDVYLERYA